MNPDEILKQLEPLADPEYRKTVALFAPQEPSKEGGEWTTLGVRAPELREFEKSLFATLRSEQDYRAALALTDVAFIRRQRELAVIGVEALAKLKKYWEFDLLGHVRHWIPQISDWSICDTVGYLLGLMILNGVITVDNIHDLKDHPSIWGQRVLIVALILPLRKGFGDVDAYLATISFFNGRREKSIIKAVSWALREGTKSQPEKIKAYIERYSNELHSTILREVRTKLEKGVKSVKRGK